MVAIIDWMAWLCIVAVICSVYHFARKANAIGSLCIVSSTHVGQNQTELESNIPIMS